MERTLIFKRATLPEDTVLLEQPSVMTVTAITRNNDGAITGKHLLNLDPWQISSYTVGLGDPTGQTNYRHVELTVTRGPGGDLPESETIEIARSGEITVGGVAVNEDGHRTQPHQYRVRADTLEGIDIGEYRLRPAGRNHAVLGLIVGKQQMFDGNGEPLGWVAVYDQIQVPETKAR